jgi:rare lipoprotein A
MSSLHPCGVIACFLVVLGIIVSASERPAAARERHADGATKAIWHHAYTTRSGVDRAAHGPAEEIRDGNGEYNRSRWVASGATHHFSLPAAPREVALQGERSFSGFASYYAQSQRVASGGTFDPSGYTCAHRSLPFGTLLRVADPESGRSVVVTVNDRGPFVRGRILDLSLRAAQALGMTGRGVMRVDADVVDSVDPHAMDRLEFTPEQIGTPDP